MGRRSRVIPCGTAPWRVPGAGRLRGRRAPRGRGRVAASRSPHSSGGFPSAARAEPRRPPGPISSAPQPAPPGSRGRRSPGPAGLSPCPSASGLEGQPGEEPAAAAPVAGQQRTGGATRCQLWRLSPSAGAAAAVPGPGRGHPQVPGRGREPCPRAMLPFLPHPVTRALGGPPARRLRPVRCL